MRAGVSRIMIQMAQSEGFIYISKSKRPILQLNSTQRTDGFLTELKLVDLLK